MTIPQNSAGLGSSFPPSPLPTIRRLRRKQPPNLNLPLRTYLSKPSQNLRSSPTLLSQTSPCSPPYAPPAVLVALYSPPALAPPSLPCDPCPARPRLEVAITTSPPTNRQEAGCGAYRRVRSLRRSGGSPSGSMGLGGACCFWWWGTCTSRIRGECWFQTLPVS